MKGKQNSIYLVSVPSYVCRGSDVFYLLSTFVFGLAAVGCDRVGGFMYNPRERMILSTYIAAFDLQPSFMWGCMDTSWLP